LRYRDKESCRCLCAFSCAAIRSMDAATFGNATTQANSRPLDRPKVLSHVTVDAAGTAGLDDTGVTVTAEPCCLLFLGLTTGRIG
jgi:hypothetical protein